MVRKEFWYVLWMSNKKVIMNSADAIEILFLRYLTPVTGVYKIVKSIPSNMAEPSVKNLV